MQVTKLVLDYSIPHATPGDKHYAEGYVNISCPFCNEANNKYHLGYNIEENYWHCWKCNWHSTVDVISTLLNLNSYETNKVIKKYKGKFQVKFKKPVNQIAPKKLILPSELGDFSKYQRKYLKNRNFDPDKLNQDWGVQGLGANSKLGDKDYSNRIFIPIFWNNEMVSFQGRTLNKKSDIRYKTCPKDIEVIHHKHILYGKQKHWGTTAILVEGVTDVWRLGFNAVCGFGTSIKTEQLRILIKNFTRIAVILDPDKAGKNKMRKILPEFWFHGIDAFPVETETDAGDMNQDDADHLVKQIMTKVY